MADGAPPPAPGLPPSPTWGNPLAFYKWWWQTLGKAGVIVTGAFLVGAIACMLPWYSWSGTTLFGNNSGGASAFNDWRGNLAFLCEAAATILAVIVAVTKTGANEKNFCFGVLGGAAGGLLFTLLFILWAMGNGRSIDSAFVHVSSGLSIGPWLNLAAAGGIGYGGFLMAKEKGALK